MAIPDSSLAAPQIQSPELHYEPEMPLVGASPRETTYVPQTLVHRYSQQHFSQQPRSENTPQACRLRRKKQNVVHPRPGVLSGNECGEVPAEDGPQKQDAKRKKPGTKSHALYDSIFMKCAEQADL